jgi:Na+-transporting NADH:ubiquinone oxidoreductase subunit NqrB
MFDRSVSIVNTMASVYVMVNIDNPVFYFLAICFGIASKYLFKVRNRHIFNPGNIGIVLSLLFISDYYVRIVYNQFAMSNPWLLVFILVNGVIITVTAKRFILAVAYTAANVGFIYALSPFYGYTRTFLIGPTLSLSGLLFIFFMITDPKTTPSKWYEQIIFAVVSAFISALLRVNEMVHDAFVALFLTTALYTIIRYDRLKNPAAADVG